EQPPGDAVDVAERKRGRDARSRVQRRPGRGAEDHQGQDDRAAGAEGPLLSPEDEEFAVSHIPNTELRAIPGVYGHFSRLVSIVADRANVRPGLTRHGVLAAFVMAAAPAALWWLEPWKLFIR